MFFLNFLLLVFITFLSVNTPGKRPLAVITELQSLMVKCNLPNEISFTSRQGKHKTFQNFIRFTTLKVVFEATHLHSEYAAKEKAARDVISYFESLQKLVSSFYDGKFCFCIFVTAFLSF